MKAVLRNKTMREAASGGNVSLAVPMPTKYTTAEINDWTQ